jgi:hypothetical protein
MNACMKSLLAVSCLLTVSCSGGSDNNKSEEAPAANPAPAPVPTPTPEPTSGPAPAPVEPNNKGFRFVNDKEAELPIYVRGDMNSWLGGSVSAELLAASRLNLDAASGCYVGTLNLQAGQVFFRLATYVPEAKNTGWEYLKVGLGAMNTSTPVILGEETKVDVYYFRAGDADGNDLGGGGNFAVNFPATGDYVFKFCTQVDDYTQSTLTVSAK